MQEVISISGIPFAGVSVASRHIAKKYGFKMESMNTLLDILYNDFKSIMNFTYPQRSIAKTDVVLKNAYMLERTVGIPLEISIQYLRKWVDMIENKEPPLHIKCAYNNDMNLLFANWRKIFVREDINSLPTTNFVIAHAITKSEYLLKKNSVRIWIETEYSKCYQNAYQHGCLFDTSIYTKPFITEVSRLKEYADFIVYNDGSLPKLYKQLNEVMGVLGFEK